MQKREVKSVLFDLDGVLVDSIDAWYYVFNDTLKYFGLKTLKRKEFVEDFGAPIEKDIKKYYKGKTVKEIENIYNINFKKRRKYVKLSKHSLYVLKELNKLKIKVGLITNSTKFITLTILDHFRLKKYFSVIVTMDDVKRRKPAPDMVLKACKILNVNPKSTILIGDTKNDMIAGKRAKCITVGYKIKGDFKINTLNEVIKFTLNS